MTKWWNWILGIAIVCLMLLVIPLTYTGSKSKEELRPLFDEYVEKFNKSYKNNDTEYEMRFEHFVASVREIDALNAASRGPEECRAKYGLTHISDLSKEEFAEIHLSDEQPHRRRHENTEHHRSSEDDGPHNNIYIIIRRKRATMPLKVDWREKGLVGPVKDQGLCGACWAFSTIGAMETMAGIKSGTLKSLSVQEVIDCAGLGNVGCSGGDICLLLDWLLMTNTAVQTESEYPLKLANGFGRSRGEDSGNYSDTRTRGRCCQRAHVAELSRRHHPVPLQRCTN
ncbi:unnamed protein product [Leptidea sinapis]|uniref:Cathepsin propeptide inhibitor domain-containing protein n=1 Tax=Leptidea sinapis TaxID=189913 RepID=A0A5E4QVE4_9NEOP|nr:unnamed protein product [Leptidea sinapis]